MIQGMIHSNTMMHGTLRNSLSLYGTIKPETVPKLRKISGLPPLTYTAEEEGTLNNYRIYGNKVSGESVGDKTANLFDGNWLQGYWKFNTGEWNDSSQYIATSIIDCTPNTDYTFSLTGKPINYGFIWYNQAGRRIASNYDHVEEGGSPTHYTATSPASAAFMAVNISREADKTTIVPQDVTDFMLVEGSVSSPYEPYGYRVPVIVEGKNLFDYDTITHGYRIQWSTGANYADETAIMSDFISVSENSTYATDTNVYWICYDTNKQYIGAWNGSDIVKSGVEPINSMTAISPCKFIRILSFGRKTTPISSATMLNYGSTALPYEPYHTPITTPIYLPEQIRKVGDEAEYIDYGEQKQHRVRKNLFYITKFTNNNTQSTAQGVNFSIIDNEVYANGTSTGIYPQVVGFDYVLTEGETYAATLYIEGEYTGLPYIYCTTTYDSAGNYQKVPPNVRTIFTALPDTRILFVAQGTGESFNIKYKLLITKATIEDDTYEPYIENTEVDVTLPALPTLPGTNVLSVGTEVQPSEVEVKGRIGPVPTGGGE